MKIILLCVLFVLVVSGPVFTQDEEDNAPKKKVLILDFKNILHRKDYDYLETSLTSAVRQKLSDKFVFEETDSSLWKSVARKNYIVEEDLYTYTAAMNLGLLTRQDVVIFGGFVVEEINDVAYIKTRIRILDITSRVQIADLQSTNPIDGSIFTTIEKIAEKLAFEAKNVLPNKTQWEKKSTNIGDGLFRFNQLSIGADLHALPLGDVQTSLKKNITLTPADLSPGFGFSLEYQRYKIFMRLLNVFVQFHYRMAFVDFPISGYSQSVPAELSSIGIVGGAGYRFPVSNLFYIQPYAGIGYYFNSITLDFTGLSVQAVNAAGGSAQISILKANTPALKIGTRFGYQINYLMGVEVGAAYNIFLYGNTSAQTISVDLRFSFYM